MAQENSDQDLIHSDLETTRTEGSHSVRICIYAQRIPIGSWN